jgi:endonuclease YncB( thermonuclease family)
VTLHGRVVSIADGDTLTVLDVDNQQHIIRLDGIDAPVKAQPFGNVSKRHLSELDAERREMRPLLHSAVDNVHARVRIVSPYHVV